MQTSGKITSMNHFPDPPERTGGDALHKVSSIIAGLALPIVGRDLFELFIRPPLEKRNQEWSKSLAEAINIIAERKGLGDLESLQNDPAFISAVVQVSLEAMAQHRAEKLRQLRNVLVNGWLDGNVDDDRLAEFIRLVGELTITHFVVLKYFDGRAEAIGKLTRSLLSPGYLEVGGTAGSNANEYIQRCAYDLEARGLLYASPAPVSPHNTCRISRFGEQLLANVADP